jgi:maleate cis-trans isomerase
MTSPLNVGLMVPSNNTTLERELPGWLPRGSQFTTLKIPRGNGLLTVETLPAYTAGALKLAQRFTAANIDVVLYGCTAAGFISGPSGDASLTKELAQITGKPVVTVARAMVRSLQAIGATKIALVTPYIQAVNDSLKAFLAASGIEARRFNSFYAPDVDALGRIEADAVAAMARQTMDEGCDAMFIACAQLPTQSIRDELEKEFGRPVLSSNFAATREAVRAVALNSATVESNSALNPNLA